jgi:hypothetical protein
VSSLAQKDTKRGETKDFPFTPMKGRATPNRWTRAGKESDVFQLIERGDAVALSNLLRDDDQEEVHLPRHLTVSAVIRELPLNKQWSILVNVLNRLPATAVDHIASNRTSADWKVLRNAFAGPSEALTRRLVTYALTFQNQTVAVKECHPFVLLFVDVMETVGCNMSFVLAMVLKATGRSLGFVQDLCDAHVAPDWLIDSINDAQRGASRGERVAELARVFSADALIQADLDASGDCHPWAKSGSVSTIRRNAFLYLSELACRGYPKAILVVRGAAMLLPGTLLLEGLTHAIRSTQLRVVNRNRRFTDPDDALLGSPLVLGEGHTADQEEDESFGIGTRLGSMCLLDAARILRARFPAPRTTCPSQQQGHDDRDAMLVMGPYQVFVTICKIGLPPCLAWLIATQFMEQRLDAQGSRSRGLVMMSLFTGMIASDVLGEKQSRMSSPLSTCHIVMKFGWEVLPASEASGES